jgi:DNA-binding NarL/FixJ family response regulator
MQDTSTRVLIVEDEPVTRRGLQLFVAGLAGVEIAGIAVSGEEALKGVEALKPDLVLMDIGLPGIDGIEAARQIKKMNAAQRILMLTADDSAEAVISAFSAGADGYVLKTSFAGNLELAIRTVHCGSIWLDPQIARSILSLAVSSPGSKDSFALSSKQESILSKVAGSSNCKGGVCFVEPAFLAGLKRLRQRQNAALAPEPPADIQV